MFKKLKLKKIINSNGELTVAQLNSNFIIKRIFSIKAKKNSIRGEHAHKKCRQILYCLEGEIKVELTNGLKKKTIILTPKSDAILIPCYTWASQKFNKRKSILNVICDKNFSESDYIRDYQKFLRIKKI